MASPSLHRRFDHVFVATDFSASAGFAIARAGLVPLAEGARITVVHTLPEAVPERAYDSVEKAARRQLEDAVVDLSMSIGALERTDIKISSELCRGPAYVEIIRHARAVGADLIVIGRHGRRPVRDLFLGSTAARVIRCGDLPVLVVSQKATRRYQRPLIAVDLEDTCRSVVDLALRLVAPDVDNVTMVHAYHVPFEGFMTPGARAEDMTISRRAYRQAAVAGVARLRASLGDVGVRWQTSIERGDPRTMVIAEATHRRADLLAMGTHGRNGVAHALVGSVAEWLIEAAACDVLIARPARVSFELP
jgi:nucleotide-binding universal stress UspA family protein